MRRYFQRLSVLVFSLFFMAVLSLWGYFYYQNEVKTSYREIRNGLQAIASLKIQQISDWYEDELGDAGLIAQNAFLIDKIEHWMVRQTAQDSLLLDQCLYLLDKEHDYISIRVCSADGRLLLSNGENKDPLSPQVLGFLRVASEKASGFMVPMYRDGKNGPLHMDYIAPVFDDKGTLLCLLVFQTNPNRFLFPLLQSWPISNKSGETMLVRKENDKVLYLNEFPGANSSSFDMSLPIDNDHQVAVAAVTGKTGFFDGVDYRGQKVLAWIGAIPGTDLYLIAKADKEELLTELNYELWLVAGFMVLLLAVFILILAILYKNHQQNNYRTLLDAQSKFELMLNSIGDAVITTDRDGQVEYLNQVAEQLTGWSLPDAQRKNHRDIFKLHNSEQQLIRLSPVAEVLRNGIPVDSRERVMLVSREGEEIPVMCRYTPVKATDQQMVGVMITFRDLRAEEKTLEMLAETESNYRKMFANNPQPMWIYSLDDLRFLEVNFATLSHYGYSRDEFLSMTLKDIRPAEDVAAFVADVEVAGDYYPAGVWRHIKKNGEIMYVDVVSHRITFNGLPARHVLIKDVTDQKKAEAALLNSNRLLRAIIDNLPDAVYLKDTNGRKLISNKADQMNCRVDSEAELIGKDDFSIFPAEQAEIFRKDDQQVILSGEPILNKEETITGQEQEIRWILSSKFPFRDSDGNIQGLVGIGRDITEWKAMSEALRESEEQYRTLFENHSAVKLMIDTETGRIVNANAAAEKFYGWPREQLTEMTIQQINTLPKKDFEAEFERARRDKRTFFEFRHRLADGSVKDVNVFASRIEFRGKDYLHSIVQDVSGRKEIEKQLRLLSKSIEQSPVGIIVTSLKGEIEYVNPGFTRISGYSADDVRGKTPAVLKSGTHDSAFYSDLWMQILSGKRWEGELQNRKKTGELYWVKTIISPVVEADGFFDHFVAVSEDITDQKKILEDLIQAKERAQESDRLKSAFLANMSHEIRTPLNAIIGFTEMLATDDTLTKEERNDFFHIITRSTDGLLQIIGDILDISRLETGQVVIKPHTIDVGQLLSEMHLQALKKMDDLGKTDIELSVLHPESPLVMLVDEVRLTQIVMNLLNNSLKFTSTGSIRFGVSSVQFGRVWFEVADTGIGISPENVGGIFERFRQVEGSSTRHYGGAGLGLSIVKSLVELMGGQIYVESALGNGSVFRFYLPHRE